MQMTILPDADADAVARQAATIVAAAAREAVAARGRCILAVSGGHTPWHRVWLFRNDTELNEINIL
jgi:6-phosphogluconolactonase/glucosamine-6-phosphate isomerase/deaminase